MHPRAFRISSGNGGGGQSSGEALFRELADLLENRDRVIESANEELKTRKRELEESGDLPEEFAVVLGNQCFRIKRNLEALVQSGTESKETRMLKRSLDAVTRDLESRQVEVLDLTGQSLEAGQMSFEMVGEPEKRPGLTKPTIVFCERPAIMISGKLVQASKGVAAVPA